MSDPEKILRRFANAREKIEAFARDETVWKRRLADAVIDLLRAGTPITAATLRAHMLATADKPIVISGAEMKIEFSREASLAAIAHLDEIGQPPGNDPD